MRNLVNSATGWRSNRLVELLQHSYAIIAFLWCSNTILRLEWVRLRFTHSCSVSLVDATTFILYTVIINDKARVRLSSRKGTNS